MSRHGSQAGAHMPSPDVSAASQGTQLFDSFRSKHRTKAWLQDGNGGFALAATPPPATPASRRNSLRSIVGRALLFARVQAMPELQLDARGRVANYKIVGKPWALKLDILHSLLQLSSPLLLMIMFSLYTIFALIFALIYFSIPGAVRNLVSSSSVDSFSDSFYFSLQTLSTIGYGSLIPQSHAANVFSLIESFLGLAFAAVFTGVFFAKLSAPNARIAFSKYATTQPIDGKLTLVIRVCNQRETQIVKAQAQACVLIKETTLEGQTAYVYKELTLKQPRIPVFTAGWRLQHQIDSTSPLYGLTAVNAREMGVAAIHAVVSGVEEVYGQHVFERTTLLPRDIKFNHTFVRMFEEVEVGSPYWRRPAEKISDSMANAKSLVRQGTSLITGPPAKPPPPPEQHHYLRFHLERIHQVEEFTGASKLHMVTKLAKDRQATKRHSESDMEREAVEVVGRLLANDLRASKAEGGTASGAVDGTVDRAPANQQAADSATQAEAETAVMPKEQAAAPATTNAPAAATASFAAHLDDLDV